MKKKIFLVDTSLFIIIWETESSLLGKSFSKRITYLSTFSSTNVTYNQVYNVNCKKNIICYILNVQKLNILF